MRNAQSLSRFYAAFLLAGFFSFTPTFLNAQCPTIAAILIDACGTEQLNEFVVINSGGGFAVSNLQMDFDINNNIIGPENNDININAAPCGLQPGNPSLISGCANVIPIGPGGTVPPNAYVILQTSNGANISYDFSGVCGTQQCVYVIQSTCTRSAGAFTNIGTGTRTTVLGLTSPACSNSYTYDRALLSGVNGDYFIPPGTYGNAGCVAPPVSFGNPPTSPTITGVPSTICQSAAPVTLSTTQSGITGTWSGPGVSGNTFNPAGLSGTVTLTFTPTAGQCANPATVSVTISPPPNLSGVTSNSPVCVGQTLQFTAPTIANAMYSWSGPNAYSSQVQNPSIPNASTNMSGTYTLTVTVPGCSPVQASVNVTVNPVPIANPVTFVGCGPGGVATFDLVANNNIVNGGIPANTVNWYLDPNGTMPVPNPSAYTTSSTTVFAQVTSGNCSSPVVPITLTVNPPATPQLGTATICNTSGLYNLTQLIDPNYPNGTWSGPNVSGNNYNPAGQSGNVTLTFTPSAPCTQAGNTTIVVNSPSTPAITGVPASICQNAAPVALPTNQSGVVGNWSGTGVSGNSFNPAGQSGSITLTFTPNAGQCANTATTMITVNQPVTPTISGLPASLCQNAAPVALPTTQSGINGNWSGAGVSVNNFNPAGLNGSVTLTFTPTAGQCAGNATASITVNAPVTPVITGIPSSFCQNDPAVALPATQSGINGNWSGTGVSGNNFNPAGLNGSITLTFTPTAGQCANTATITVTVNAPATPVLGTTSLCQTANVYNLSNIADPNYPAGTWSGAGVSGNNFNPAGLSGPNVLTFTPSAACTQAGTTTITVNVPASPQLGSTTLCQNSGVFNLAALADPAYPNGTWAGTGVSGNNFNPAGPNGSISLTFTPSAACTQANTTTIIVNTAPTFSNLIENCNPATQQYTVSFDISGGAAGTYTVNGTAVGGSTYTSGLIASGTPYSFNINDANGCGPVTVSGVANCLCATSAGTMNFAGSPLMICNGSAFTVIHNGNENLDPDDVLQFVLHTNSGAQLGNVIATSNTTTFPYPSGVVLGQTYYVSAVAGTNNGAGNPDPADGCLSVSQGVPVVFYQPTVQLSNGGTICESECFDFTVQFTGIAPFSLDYEVMAGGNPFIENITSNTNTATITICPANYGVSNGQIAVNFSALNDANCLVSFNTPTGQTLTVHPLVSTSLSPTLCPGGSLVVNGTAYNAANPTGSETFTAGSWLGCDSTVNINLSFYQPAQFNFNQTLCTGGSVTVNGTVYNESNPSGTEILQNASVNGCDSTIIINLTFNSQVTNNLNQTLCPNDSITVNSTVYNAANPSGSETFPGGSYLGCDSIVIVNLSFYQPAVFNFSQTICSNKSIVVNGTAYNQSNPSGTEVLTGGSWLGCDSTINISLNFYPAAQFNLTQTLCTGGSIMVNGTTYNQANPSGTEVLQNASVNGCDSTVFVNLSFNNAVTFNLSQTLCPGGSIIVNGTTYNQANPTGSQTFTNGSWLGCDSTVNINLSFYQPAVNNLTQTLCTGGSIMVNGTTYNQANPSGTQVLQNASVNGCDSTVNVNLSFNSTVTFNLNQTLCPGGSIIVNGTTYNQANPSGSQTFANGSWLGCDSTVNVNLAFYQPATFNLTQKLCSGGSIVVNGKTYNAANPTGTEILQNASINGCDSTVNVNLTFFQPVVYNLTQQLCTGGSITVNGTVYNAANPNGTEVLQNASINGCDSTVNVNLTFGNSVIVSLAPKLCPGESIFVNGTLYYAGNPNGTQTFPGGSWLGCDSTVNIALTFFPEATGSFQTTLQPGQTVVVNGTVYSQQNPTGTEIIVGGSWTGCDSTVFVSLNFSGVFSANFTFVSPSCKNGDDGSLTIHQINGGVPPFKVALDGANSTTVTTLPLTFNNLDAGFHQITLLDSTGTIVLQDVLIPEPPELVVDLGDDIFINLGEDAFLSPQATFPVAAWAWSPPDFLDCDDCPNPSAVRPGNDITYTLTATNANGCTATGTVTVFIKKIRNIFVPNVFSPNGDGINDVLTVFAGGQISKVKSFMVFNRWGDKMHEFYNFPPNDFQYGWDGEYRGKKLDPDVFVWFAEVEFVDGHVELFEGGVTLMR